MIKLPTEIHSERLILKPVQKEDLDVFYEAFSESFESLTEYYSPAWSQFKTLPSKEDMGKSLEQFEKLFDNQTMLSFSVFDKKSNEFLGQGGIHHIDYSVPKMRLGYWTRKSARGKGYGTEMGNILTQFCFDIMGCERLEIRNDLRNPGSGGIAKALNYQFLTVFEKNKRGKDEELWDLEIYVTFDKDKLPPLDVQYIRS